MKTKIMLLALIGIVLFLSAFALLRNGQESISVVSAQDLYEKSPTITPYSPSVLGVSESAIQKYARSEIVSSSAHGIQISAANFRIDGNKFKADVCFQYPNNGDWTIGEADIQIQDIKIHATEYKSIELTQTVNGEKKIISFLDSSGSEVTMVNLQIINNDGLPDYRCDTLLFRLKPDLLLSHVKLIINSPYAEIT